MMQKSLSLSYWALAIICLMNTNILAAANIRVVYPKEDQFIGAVDSSFIFGSVKKGWSVAVNGHGVDVHDDGGWIAFLPLEPGAFTFQIVAQHTAAKGGASYDTLNWPVRVPELPGLDSFDSLTIYPNFRLPGRKQSLGLGEILKLQFRAQPGCVAWAEIPGYNDSVPMIESDGLPAPFYSRSVFENNEDSAEVRIYGIYQGMYTIDIPFQSDSQVIVYHVAAPTRQQALDYLRRTPIERVNFNMLRALDRQEGDSVKFGAVDTLRVALSINSPEFPRALEFTDTTQIMRVGPRRGYLGLFQPTGIRALAVGFEGDWFKIKLSESRYGYVNDSDATLLGPGILPPQSRLTSWKAVHEGRETIIRARLSAKHPYSISAPNPRTLVVELFGVEMDTDWFRYDFADRYLRHASWTQPEPDLYRLELRFTRPLWGYRAGYNHTDFELTLIYPPENLGSLSGKRIVVDPGHAPDPGSVGPTGLTESEANLKLALVLRDELKRRGAQVIMTRIDSQGLPLYSRPKVADSMRADLFISIHNNALPDGVNPFENYGVSTYYYHTHSLALSRWIHQEMLKLPKQRDHGWYHGNLAVCRPTGYPSVLVECGFMILPEQEKWLKTKRYRKQVARAITNGIAGFLKNYDKIYVR